MKKLSKIMAVVLAAVLAMVMCVLPAGAESIFTSAKSIESGTTYSIKISRQNDIFNYKINVGKSGELKVNVTSYINDVHFRVFDKDGTYLLPDVVDDKSGQYKSNYPTLYWNVNTETYKGTLTYDVKPGTYYIQFSRFESFDGKVTFSVKAPGSSSSSNSSVSSSSSNATLKLVMDEGDKITLGALVSGKEKDVTWTSSKSSVAKVSSKGRVSAVKEGTATLTAKSGEKTILTVVVEVQ